MSSNNILRVNFQCWSCKESFELSLSLNDGLQYVKECVHCGADCIIDLSPYYRDSEVDVLRGKGEFASEQVSDGQLTSGQLTSRQGTLNIPKEVPTTEPKETTSDSSTQ